jgi:tetratricopeptide (TPR) repeat protein
MWASAAFSAPSPSCAVPQALRGSGAEKDTATRLSRLGQFYVSQKNYLCAANTYGRAAAFVPNSPKFAYLWALSLYSAGKYSEALEPIERALKLSPHDLNSRLLFAATLDHLGRVRDGERQWREALALSPDSATALYALSQDLLEEKDFTGVVTLLFDRRPEVRTSVQALNLGIALAAVGRINEAAAVLRSGLDAYPDSLPIANELAMSLMVLGRFDEAFSTWDRVLQKNPNDEQTQIRYLEALVLSRPDLAEPRARRMLAAYPHQWEVLYLNAIVDSREGLYPQARHLLQESVSANPAYAPTHRELGKVLDKMGDLSASKAELETAISLGDTQTDVQYQLGRVLRGMGETESAKAKMRIAQDQKNADIAHARSVSTTDQGDREVANGNTRRGIDLYREALSFDSSNAVIHYKLAMALDKINDTIGETAALLEAIKFQPDLPEAQNQLGFLAVRAGDASRAGAYFRAAIQASPSFFPAWINLSATLASEAKWQEAQEAADHALQLDPQNSSARDLKRAIQNAQNLH